MPTVATIGFFDGVHRGHRMLIGQVLRAACDRGARSLLLTFDRHPRTVFASDGVPHLLTSHTEKMRLLAECGADDIHVLRFDKAMAALTAPEFMRSILQEQLGVTTLVIGYDHHFGRPLQTPHGSEQFDDYRAYGQDIGMEVVGATELEDEHVSSSAIRRALAEGNVEAAAQMLGRPYTWAGHVVHGHAIGHTLGYPTANLVATDDAKVMPRNGAYAVRANGKAAMLNIGTRPTIDDSTDVSVEAHIFDFQGDLYDTDIDISFVARLRPEQRFDSEDALIRQLDLDKQQALAILRQ